MRGPRSGKGLAEEVGFVRRRGRSRPAGDPRVTAPFGAEDRMTARIGPQSPKDRASERRAGPLPTPVGTHEVVGQRISAVHEEPSARRAEGSNARWPRASRARRRADRFLGQGHSPGRSVGRRCFEDLIGATPLAERRKRRKTVKEDRPIGLSCEDFVNSRPLALLEDEREAGVGCDWDDAWAVAPGYELRGPNGGPPAVLDDRVGASASGLHLAAAPAADREGWARWKNYAPLRDEPDLFLGFARLGEGEPSSGAILEWVGEHGLLGCGEPAVHRIAGQNAGWFGRPEDGLGVFADEARRAAALLRWCDALLEGDEDRLVEAVSGYPAVEYNHPRPRRIAELSDEDLAALATKHRDSAIRYYDGDLRLLAADLVAWEVNERLRFSCYRVLKPFAARTPRRVVGGWGFTSLLGAMYLQLSWVLETGIFGPARER